MEKNLTKEDFLAYIFLQQRQIQKRGYSMSTRWLCTAEEYKKLAKEDMEEAYKKWKAEELRAKRSRENNE